MPEKIRHGCCTVIFQIALKGIWPNERRKLKNYGTLLPKFI